MLTYVINTSENKTFASDQLFKLVGYNKIRWMNYGLDDLERCAEEICERQMVLGADDFRVAILVDFYGFDRVRSVYGAQGFSPIEKGVDLSVYFPLLEAYMVDHLFSKIMAKQLFVRERHVFYIQDDKNDGFNILVNKKEQVEYILEPKEESVTEVITETVALSELNRKKKKEEEKASYEQNITDEDRENVVSEFESKKRELETLTDEKLKERQDKKIEDLQQQVDDEENRDPSEKEVYVEVPYKRYSSFMLHCTETLSLEFKITDYPYTNLKGLTFDEFYLAFKQRESQFDGIIRHHYYASFGSGAAKAAFDNLSLSLYLIKLYEREEPIREDKEFVSASIRPEDLKQMLITSWNKICSARTIALGNDSKYYDIKSLVSDTLNVEQIERDSKAYSEVESRAKAGKEVRGLSPEKIFEKIAKITSEPTDTFSEEDKKELDALMAHYLSMRDETKESACDNDFDTVKEDCKQISQCPSENDYENVVEKKKKTIAEVLSKTIEAEYISKDFTEEKERAEKAYNEYLAAKACLGKSLFGDLFIWLLMLVVMMVPFFAIEGFRGRVIWIYVFTAGLFTGLYALAFFIRIIPIISKMNRAHRSLKNCFFDCYVKQDLAMLKYKIRYEDELIRIENLRYELRNITHLHALNRAKNKNIEEHRKALEDVENKLSAMLNNLGVEPVVVQYKHLEGEFDVNKSVTSPENKIYKIFSLDAIEGLFGGKEN